MTLKIGIYESRYFKDVMSMKDALQRNLFDTGSITRDNLVKIYMNNNKDILLVWEDA